MYKICKTEKSLQRQRELEEGFLSYMETVLFFEIEIADLCRFLNIPRKTFYRYFGSREDALYALVDHRLHDLEHYVCRGQLLSAIPPREQAIRYFTFWKEQKRFLDILGRNYLLNTLLARAVLPENIPEGLLDSSILEKDSSDSYLFNFCSTGTLAMMLQWHNSGYQKEIHEMADIAIKVFEITNRFPI